MFLFTRGGRRERPAALPRSVQRILADSEE